MEKEGCGEGRGVGEGRGWGQGKLSAGEGIVQEKAVLVPERCAHMM